MIRQLKQSDIPKLREELLFEQGGICPICKYPIEDGTACLDHEHRRRIKGSGQLRAVLCRACNTFLGKLENNSRRCNIPLRRLPMVLRRISKYLLEEHKPFIHPSEREKTPKLQLSSYNSLKKKYKGRAKFPEFTFDKKGNPNQKLTIKLKQLFEQHDIEPKFYSK